MLPSITVFLLNLIENYLGPLFEILDESVSVSYIFLNRENFATFSFRYYQFKYMEQFKYIYIYIKRNNFGQGQKLNKKHSVTPFLTRSQNIDLIQPRRQFFLCENRFVIANTFIPRPQVFIQLHIFIKYEFFHKEFHFTFNISRPQISRQNVRVFKLLFSTIIK